MQPSNYETHVGNIPRNTVQPSANEYTNELPSFIERTKQQKYCNSIRGTQKQRQIKYNQKRTATKKILYLQCFKIST